MAVELAKVSLWLDAFTIGAPLSFLDHHLRCGNSLVGATFKDLESATTGQLFGIDYEPLVRAIRHVIQVNQMADATAAEVQQSASEYGRARIELSGYQVVLDLLLAKYFGFPDAVKLLSHYGKNLDLSSAHRFKTSLESLEELATVDRIEALARQADRRFFHWEIEFPEVFFGFADADGRRVRHKDLIVAGSAGFDSVVGNPPYDVLAEKELGIDLSELLTYFRSESRYACGLGGKLNLYKLFICRNVPLARHGGGVGHIVPMPLLGDEQAVGVRKMLLAETAISRIDAFPQKDDPSNRVFEDAKLSTCVFVTRHSTEDTPIRVRVHPGKEILASSPALSMRRNDVKLYDAENEPIVACSQADWNLATKIMGNGRMSRIRDTCKFFQGEINETNERAKGTISPDARIGPCVLRASALCLYVVREPSQKTTGDLYADIGALINRKRPDAKIHHFRHERVGVQGNAPQNNFRRLVSALIPAGTICFYTINYAPAHLSSVPIEAVLALLNSQLCEWYFRLGSSNAHANQYQLHNLPAPHFANDSSCLTRVGRFTSAMANGDTAAAFESITDLLNQPPFSVTVRDCIVAAVKRIIEIEHGRGDIARHERSALAPAAQPLQDLLDRIFYRLAGLSDDEAAGLEERLSRML